MCVLILSYKPETDEVAKGCCVGTYRGDTQVQYCATGEEAINHVAYLNGYNEPGAANYDHWFIYPDEVCPYDSKDTETGEVRYKNYCIPMSQAKIEPEDDYGGIPEHLRAAVEAKEKEFRSRAQKEREDEEEARRKKVKEDHRDHQERQFEYLKQELGK